MNLFRMNPKMSKLLIIIFATLAILLIGAGGYLAFVEVPVQQETVTTETTLHELKQGRQGQGASE